VRGSSGTLLQQQNLQRAALILKAYRPSIRSRATSPRSPHSSTRLGRALSSLASRPSMGAGQLCHAPPTASPPQATLIL